MLHNALLTGFVTAFVLPSPPFRWSSFCSRRHHGGNHHDFPAGQTILNWGGATRSPSPSLGMAVVVLAVVWAIQRAAGRVSGMFSG